MRSIRAAAVLLVAAACAPDAREPKVRPVPPHLLPPEAEFLGQVDKTMGRRDCFTVVRDGRFVPAAEAPRMRDDERVLGLDLGSEQFAYPIQFLNLVEIVEHSAAGRELLVCWCPLCGTGVAHERRAAGRTLSFGHSGWLWRSAFLLYDRETDSLWHHATGVAMAGSLRGARLPRIDDTAVMTFAAWRAEHPATRVLAKPADPSAPVERDVYAERTARTTWGVSVEGERGARFYPFVVMSGLDAVEDAFEGTPLVVVRDAAAALGRAYDRRVGGAALSFDVVAGEPPALRERGGTRSWSLRSGRPLGHDGPALCPLPATQFERAAWQSHHPEGSVWRRP